MHNMNKWCNNIHAKSIDMEDAWQIKARAERSKAIEKHNQDKDQRKGRNAMESKNATKAKIAHLHTAKDRTAI